MSDRELFSKYMKKEHPFILEGSPAYLAMFSVWQASANRQGYKLLPVEATQKMLDAADRCAIPALYVDSISGQRKLIIGAQYKAMIGAVE